MENVSVFKAGLKRRSAVAQEAESAVHLLCRLLDITAEGELRRCIRRRERLGAHLRDLRGARTEPRRETLVREGADVSEQRAERVSHVGLFHGWTRLAVRATVRASNGRA